MAGVTSLSGQSSIYGIVSALLSIERQPITKMQTRKQDLTVLNGLYGDLRSKLASLRTSANSLAEAANSPLSARSVTTSNASIVTATAGASAALGTNTVRVSQLAKNHTLASNQLTRSAATLRGLLGEGGQTFSITVNGVETSVTVSIGAEDTDGDILAATAAAINAAMEGVTDRATATALNDTSATGKLVLRSEGTGLEKKMALSDSGGGLLAHLGILDTGAAATETTGGYIHADSELNARLTVNGVSITRSSNVITDALADITLTLHGEQAISDNAVSLTVAVDAASVKSTVESFISKFNDAVSYLKAKTAVNTTTGTRSALSGQMLYRSLLAELRGAAGGAMNTGMPSISTLADIGITQAADGTLSLSDTEAFNAAVTNSQSAVKNLFTGTDGLAARVDALLDPFLNAGGHLDSDVSNITDRQSAMDETIKRMEARMAIREKMLIRQYSSLQEGLAQLSNHSDYLGSFLQSMTYS